MADAIPFIETAHPALGAPIQGQLAPTPYNFEFTGEDFLRLTVANTQVGVSVAVHYRLTERGGRIVANSYRYVPTTDGLATTTEFGLGEGYLLNVTLFANAGTPKRGQTYAKLQVIRGRGAIATVLGTIAAGYVTALQDRAWPGSPIEGSTDGDGYERVVTGTGPAPSTEIAETVPTGRRWELRSFYVSFVPSVVVGTRRPRLRLTDGTDDLLIIPSPVTAGASDTNTYAWLSGLAQDVPLDADMGIAGLPFRTSLQAGHKIFTSTANLQAGDQYSAPRLAIREWLEV